MSVLNSVRMITAAGDEQPHDPEGDDDTAARHHLAAHHRGSGVMVISVRSPSRSTVSMLRMTVPSPCMRIVVKRSRSRWSRGSSISDQSPAVPDSVGV